MRFEPVVAEADFDLDRAGEFECADHAFGYDFAELGFLLGMQVEDKFIVNLMTESWRRDPLPVGKQEWDQDELNQLADKSLPDLMTAAIKGTNKAYLDDNRPTADIILPSVDEYHLGQLFQMLMIATVVEGRLMELNPYGQPGVEAYKVNMKAELGV